MRLDIHKLEAERDGAVKRAVTAEKDRKSARETWEKADALLSEVLPERARLKRELADAQAERDELQQRVANLEEEPDFYIDDIAAYEAEPVKVAIEVEELETLRRNLAAALDELDACEELLASKGHELADARRLGEGLEETAMMLLADIEHRELEEVAGARTLHQACGEVRVALADWHDRFPKEVANADQ